MSIKARITAWWRSVTPDEWRLVEHLRALYRLLTTAPALALSLLDLLPPIVAKMRELQLALPQSGRGPERLAQLLGWIEGEHGSALRSVGRWVDVVRAVTALASVLAGVFNVFNNGVKPNA